MGSNRIGRVEAAADAGQGRRRGSLFLAAGAARSCDGARFDIVVRNLSAGGLQADTAHTIAAGEAVIVSLPCVGDVPGRVAWVQARRFGMTFDRAIDSAQLLDQVAAAPATAASTAARRSRSAQH